MADTLHVKAHGDAIRHLTARTSIDLLGLPGSGRSALARAVADELEDAGWRVVRVSGSYLLRDRPLETLVTAGLVVRQGGQQGPATALATAVQALLATLRGTSTLLVVNNGDDLDEASAGAVVAAQADARFPILSTSRPAPRSGRTRMTALVQPGLTLRVGPLGFVDMQTLLVDRLGGPISSGAVSRIFAKSGGLGGLALALADCARDHDALHVIDGVWHAGPDLWSPELVRALEPLLHLLSDQALDGLHALALAGTVELATARRFLPWDILQELDGYGLLRFTPLGGEMLVAAFPPLIVEYFRHLVGAWHLKVDEIVTLAFGGSSAHRVAAAGPPWHLLSPPRADAETRSEPTWDADDDVVFNRLLLEHWQRELLVRRNEWEQSPTPRTAAGLLRTMLVTGPDPEKGAAVRDSTPRTGEQRELVEFDAWSALFLGTVEHRIEGARAVCDRARLDAEEWSPQIEGIEAFLVLLTDHAPDPDVLISTSSLDRSGGEWNGVVATTRTELLLAKGRSAEALAELQRLGEPTSKFARARRAALPWALFLEGRPGEALACARDVLTTARCDYDIENIVGAAYVMASILMTSGRRSELRALLGSVLSSGLLPALDRPQYVALLAMAAGIAWDEGRTATSRTLAQQGLALQIGSGPYPLGSPTHTLARLESASLPPAEAREHVAERLWQESKYLLERGYTMSGYYYGMLAVAEEPTAARGAVLAQVGAEIPAPLFRHYERFTHAATQSDPDLLVRTAERLADAGIIWAATAAYSMALSAYRVAGLSARAVEVHQAARRRLAPWGRDAAAGLQSTAVAADLTAREREVAGMVASGLPNQEIAQRLHISVSTVENHLNRTFRKLGVVGRGELSGMDLG